MDSLKEDISETGECEEFCAECDCCADPEDIFWDVEKMTPEERKTYLEDLSSARSFGFCE